MLDSYNLPSLTLGRLQATPCWPYLDGYTDWLTEQHYKPSVIQLYLYGIVPLGSWLEQKRLEPTIFDCAALERFRRDRDAVGQLRHTGGKIKAAFVGALRFHQHLAASGVVAAEDRSWRARFLHREFEHWMRTHRGVGESTLRGYAPFESALLDRLGEDPARYTAATLRQFILAVGDRSSVGTAKMAATSVRALLRFLVATEQCSSALPSAIPRFASWRLAPLPTYLASADVEQLITSCAECPSTARRDRAVLLLLWRLALRAGDVADLELTDIDWRDARIRLAGKNRREVWLPLAQDVGDAIVDYLQAERPSINSQHLFLTTKAPFSSLHSSCVSSIVRRAIDRCDIDSPARGAQLLRRSAATDMLRQGATLAQIGSVLRHASVETTQLYAKVDQELLLGVAASWPVSATPPVTGPDPAAKTAASFVSREAGSC